MKKSILFPKKSSDKVVIVEDYISAIRLIPHINVICLFGTFLSAAIIPKLYQRFTSVALWLDNDDAGRQATEKLSTLLNNEFSKEAQKQAFAIREPRTIATISTKKQPKEHTDEELKLVLSGDYV